MVQCGVRPSKAEELWLQIETAYTEPGRFYHDLSHLEHLYRELEQLHFSDWPSLLFSLFYHDIIYDVEQHMVMHDNEELSADLAEQHLKSIHFPPEKIKKCKQQILATKKHSLSHDNDTNLFTDADLCILGQSWTVYNDYRQKIRLEFAVYPESIFCAGRRKVLLSFIQMNPLFKTPHFRSLYEIKAKENMERELQLLQL